MISKLATQSTTNAYIVIPTFIVLTPVALILVSQMQTSSGLNIPPKIISNKIIFNSFLIFVNFKLS